MKSSVLARLAAISLGLNILVLSGAKAAEIAPAPAKLPAMQVGCRAIQIPVDQNDEESAVQSADTENVASSEAVFEVERKAWMDGLAGSEIKRVGPLYVIMKMPPKDYVGKTWPGEICGRIDKRAEIAGFTVKTRTAQIGYAGYCATNDPEICLASIYAALKFTETTPWPRLPIYALWRSQDADPAGVEDIVKYFGSTPFDVVQPTEQEGTAQEFQIDNIQGCEGTECPSFPEAIDTTNGKGIAWFIELSEAELPTQEASDPSDANEGNVRDDQ